MVNKRKDNMTLLKFSSVHCQPCKQLSSLMQSLNELPFNVQDIDVDKETGITKMWNVRSIPTLVLLDSTGEEIKRISGALTKAELLKFLGYTQ